MEIHQKGCPASEARQAVGTAPVVKVAPQWCMWSTRQRCPHVPRRAGLSTGSKSRTVLLAPGFRFYGHVENIEGWIFFSI